MGDDPGEVGASLDDRLAGGPPRRACLTPKLERVLVRVVRSSSSRSAARRQSPMEFGVFAQLFVPKFEASRTPTRSTSASCATSRSPRRPTRTPSSTCGARSTTSSTSTATCPGPRRSSATAPHHRAGPPRLGDLQHHAAGEQAGAHRRERGPARPPLQQPLRVRHRPGQLHHRGERLRHRRHRGDQGDVARGDQRDPEDVEEADLLLRGHLLPGPEREVFPKPLRPVPPGHVGGGRLAGTFSEAGELGLGAFCFSPARPTGSRCSSTTTSARSPTPRRWATT